jgi:hypothetical protein
MAEVNDNVLLEKDDLIKSLQDLNFTQEQIDAVIEKGEKEGKFAPAAVPEKKEDEKTVDEIAAEKNEKKEDELDDKNDMKKAFDKIMSMKGELDKSMTEFLDKFGKIPGVPTPTDFTNKSVDEDIQKSFVDNIEKSFSGKFDEISKGFEAQGKINEQLLKSLETINENVNKIAEAPNPFRTLLHNYSGDLINKSNDVDGKRVISLKNKNLVADLFEKAIDKVENEQDKDILRSAQSDYIIANQYNAEGFNIVKKALDIDFEK